MLRLTAHITTPQKGKRRKTIWRIIAPAEAVAVAAMISSRSWGDNRRRETKMRRFVVAVVTTFLLRIENVAVVLILILTIHILQ